MNSLFHLQDKFQDYLLNSKQGIQQHIVSTEKVSAEVRLSIYGDAYRSRLIESLTTTYPVLQAYVGWEQFEEITTEYLKQYPSTYRSIRWFGDRLADYLGSHPDYKEYDYLSELAKLEWTLTLVFDAQDRPTAALEDVAAIPIDAWSAMQLLPHPSVHRLTFLWNTMAIWQAISDDIPPPKPMPSKSDTHWVLWRQELTNQFCSIDDDEAWAIDAILKGITFGELCEGLCQWTDDHHAPVRAASLLKGWIEAGLIAEIKIQGKNN